MKWLNVGNNSGFFMKSFPYPNSHIFVEAILTILGVTTMSDYSISNLKSEKNIDQLEILCVLQNV